jgi:hypothetical protein
MAGIVAWEPCGASRWVSGHGIVLPSRWVSGHGMALPSGPVENDHVFGFRLSIDAAVAVVDGGRTEQD